MSASMYPGGQMPTEHVGLSPRGRTGVAVSITFWFVAALFVGIRFIARRSPIRPGADDWTILLSLLFTAGLIIASTLASYKGGLGWHTVALPPTQLMEFGKHFLAEQITYSIALPTIKVSILLLYCRIFESRPFHIAAYIVGFLCVGWGLGTLFSSIFQCTPVEGAWNPPVARHCINAKAFFYGNGISTMLLDFIILAMPMPMIWRLQLDTKRKLALTGMFLLGGFVCITSILRITYLDSTDRADFTWSISIANIWTLVEPEIGIICACLPTLGPLFKATYNRHISSRYTKSGNRKGNSSKGNMRYEEIDDSNLIESGKKSNKGVTPLDTIGRLENESPPPPKDDDIPMQDFGNGHLDTPRTYR